MSSSILDDLLEFRDRFNLPDDMTCDELYKMALYYIKTGEVCRKCAAEYEGSFSDIPLPEDESDDW